ncbi:MAG: hypothetical protein ACRDRH_05285 [Pseudonocardia sp.]
MTNAVLFSESSYRQILAEFDYTPFDLRQFDFSVAGLDADTLNARYLCHHHGENYLGAAPQRRIVTTGFGMSGPPHLATVSHILKMIELQRGGERCQIVLGDLDAYNGKAKPYADVRELAERFREYSLRLGFDPHAGIVRSRATYPRWRRCTCSAATSNRPTSTQPRKTTTATTPTAGWSTRP